jgi:hypothetical protein
MHALENLLLILSARIRHETGNEELAEAAATFAGASHEYVPEREKILAEMNDDWTRRHSNPIVKPQAGTLQLPISSEEQLRTLRKFVVMQLISPVITAEWFRIVWPRYCGEWERSS